MSIQIKKYEKKYVSQSIEVWNEVVKDGIAFPQLELLNEVSGDAFFQEQTYTGLAINENDEVVGLYILHPNNIGRCGHICNASYAVKKSIRGQHIGELLVKDCIKQANLHGYRILQFNAVVATNLPALNLYKKLGFTQLGVIPGGFKMDDHYEDIIPHYIDVTNVEN